MINKLGGGFVAWESKLSSEVFHSLYLRQVGAYTRRARFTLPPRITRARICPVSILQCQTS